ncbi:uncharacterized protein AMSG_00663 [Thecamonas trahens ATCC 50062]|uniref:Uncharacterized protein n=1 Tax=Thecamonas trahens ATCC 50062 TaxID=461836 RepID=A0A0L0DDU1_THETB|nr:hypothetical protein AMSG_00663 [Thecamonas trahens ATCC 50062]KNC50502.1 hypothetical protein AMSG_00663 [Thecamonas trahens ATCC 50062]|eukprot:XP_013762395.1 hypothetical protein AMSG_00663 [Thecamonas trahens ATCC 50062]
MSRPEPPPPPGYTGHVSRLDAHFGASYGRTMRQLSQKAPAAAGGYGASRRSRPVVTPVNNASNRRSLVAALVEAEYEPPPGGAAKSSIQENRVGHPLKSGYTGYVPRAKNHHFGETFGAATYRALAESEQIRRKTQAERNLFATYAVQRSGVAGTRRTGASAASLRNPYASTSLSYRPLQVADYSLRTLDELGATRGPTEAAADGSKSEGKGEDADDGATPPPAAQAGDDEPQGFDLAAARQVGNTASAAKRSKPGFDMNAMATSPYRLPRGHPQKYFIPAYTGYVPAAQNQIGKNFSDTTRAALEEFADDCDVNETIRQSTTPALVHSIRSSYYTGGVARPPPRPAQPYVRPVPGATVHVPNAIHTIGVTYGSLVAEPSDQSVCT